MPTPQISDQSEIVGGPGRSLVILIAGRISQRHFEGGFGAIQIAQLEESRA
jgi:hypothetical protein